MPVNPDDPLRRVNMHFYEADIAFCTRHFGGGWQRQIREILRAKVNELRRQGRGPLTLGDIFGEPK